MRETDELVGLERLLDRLPPESTRARPRLRFGTARAAGDRRPRASASREQLARARANVPEAELVRASALALQLAPESLARPLRGDPELAARRRMAADHLRDGRRAGHRRDVARRTDVVQQLRRGILARKPKATSKNPSNPRGTPLVSPTR